MNKKDKQFCFFISVWVLAHVVGFTYYWSHIKDYPGWAVNLVFISALAWWTLSLYLPKKRGKNE